MELGLEVQRFTILVPCCLKSQIPSHYIICNTMICCVVETFPEVQDSPCVAQLIELEERVVLFLKMVEGHSYVRCLLVRILFLSVS